MKEIKRSALSIPVMFEKTEEISSADERFTRVKIWLMHLGKNVNGSVFDKEVVDAAIPTLGYIPIVGFIEENKMGEEDFSDHRYVLTRTENGIEEKYKGVAYGVVLSSEDNNAHYEDRLCDDGQIRTFLVVDGVAWNMFEEASAILNRDVVKAQSMELQQDEDSFDGYEDEDGYFHFTKFSFRASCILGEDYEPAMANSTVEVQFTMSDFVKSLHTELKNKYTAFTKLLDESKQSPVDENVSTEMQGGNENMPNTDFSTVLAMFSEISAKVCDHEKVVDRWGDEMPRYYAVDIQDEEIIVVDTTDNYNYYGTPFAVDGDSVVIDWENMKRKKVVYEDYREGQTAIEGAFNFGEHIEKIEEVAFEKVNAEKASSDELRETISSLEGDKAEVEANYAQMKSEYDEIKPKYDEYVKQEEERAEAELSAKKDAEFARYESQLADEPEFIALKGKKDELSLRDIETECAILFSKKKLPEVQSNYSKSNKNPIKAGIDESSDDDNKTSELYSRYGYIKD